MIFQVMMIYLVGAQNVIKLVEFAMLIQAQSDYKAKFVILDIVVIYRQHMHGVEVGNMMKNKKCEKL